MRVGFAIVWFTLCCAFELPSQAQCTVANLTTCMAMVGVPRVEGSACVCDIYEWVPRRVANAKNGDVGIVPIDGRGSEIVSSLTQALGQFHRHAVMFYNGGRRTRHNTMYLFDGEDGSTADAGGDYVTIYKPLVGKFRFDGDELQNGLPGAIAQTIDETFARGRLAETGLILKPALHLEVNPLSPSASWEITEPNRPAFRRAVKAARSTSAYYKVGDYTDQDSMKLPWSTSRTGDLRGSHCSGYITHFFREQGLEIADVRYTKPLRQVVAQQLFDNVVGACHEGLSFWEEAGLSIMGHWNRCSNFGNQVVNCFADLSCFDTSNAWRDAINTGAAVSPDNLLPASFRMTGDSSYDWDGQTLAPASTGGLVSVVSALGNDQEHPGLEGTSPATSATTASPFERVEALTWVGGYYQFVEAIEL